MRNTATVCQVRSGRRGPAGVGQLHRLLVVGQDGAWQHPKGHLGVGPAGGEIAQDLLMAVVVTGDRAAPGHMPGNAIRQQARKAAVSSPPA
jgi:hypothetical protein